MGMDYRWAGSASYPRFDRELCAVAEVFGGIKAEHLKERVNITKEVWVLLIIFILKNRCTSI